MSDLIRAHVGNGDFHPEDSSKIHWAKFNMMGKFIHLVKQYQLRSGSPEGGYFFEERPEFREILNVAVMDSEVSFVRSDVRGDNLYLRRCKYHGSPLRPTAMTTMNARTSRAPCRVITQSGQVGTLRLSVS